MIEQLFSCGNPGKPATGFCWGGFFPAGGVGRRPSLKLLPTFDFVFMKVKRILENYLHARLSESAGLWDNRTD